MQRMLPENAALILIDIQKAWSDPIWGERNNPMAEEVASDLLGKWRKSRLPVIHVRHDSLNTGSLLRHGKPGFEFNDLVIPRDDEPVIVKHVNSAFIGTGLETLLESLGIKSVFICGITTDHCVSTTARMAGNMGFSTFVVADACAAHERIDQDGKKISAEEVHRVNIASLNGEFAEVLNSFELLFPAHYTDQ